MFLLFQGILKDVYLKTEVRREMFYLMMHSTHFIYDGTGHMVKDHSDSERGNPLLPLHGLSFPISSKGSFYMPHPRQDSTYNSLFAPAMENWLEQEIIPRKTRPHTLMDERMNNKR